MNHATEKWTMPAKVKFWADPKWLTLLLSIAALGFGVAWRDGVKSKELDTIKDTVARHEKGFEKLDRIAEDVAWIKGTLKRNP